MRRTIHGDVSCAENKVSALAHKEAQVPAQGCALCTCSFNPPLHTVRLVYIRHDGEHLFLALSLSLSFAHARSFAG